MIGASVTWPQLHRAFLKFTIGILRIEEKKLFYISSAQDIPATTS